MPKPISEVAKKLNTLYPKVNFKTGDIFVWASADKTVTYINKNDESSIWALIHETAHAALGHKDYSSDHQLLKMESEAWHEAKRIATSLDIVIDDDHIEECLDTYRDWLHKRSKCPNCEVVSLQQKDRTYKCFNCNTIWKVPDSPLCNVVRRKVV